MRPFASIQTLLNTTLQTPRSRRNAAITVAAVLLVWVSFFDSHSLMRRAGWEMEYRSLVKENARLSSEIDSVSSAIDAGLTDELVEQIAREQYGMRRPGETVYRIKEIEQTLPTGASMNTFAVGIDLGGTMIKAALVERGQGIRELVSIDTLAEEGPEPVIDRIAELVRRLDLGGS